jgi:hypothetical protein
MITYKCEPPCGKILQHCIGLNIPEPLDQLLAGNQLNLTGFEKENYSYIRKDAVIRASKGLTHFP